MMQSTSTDCNCYYVFYMGEKRDFVDVLGENFSKIGELRSPSLSILLLSLSNSNCKSVKKEQILKQSCFCHNHIVQIDSPDRLNIKIYVKCVKKKIILTLVTIFKGKMHIELWYFAKALKTTMLSTRCSEGNVMLL